MGISRSSGVEKDKRFLHPLRPARSPPGDTCVLKGTYKVTQADVDAGSFVNKVEATMKEVSEGDWRR